MRGAAVHRQRRLNLRRGQARGIVLRGALQHPRIEGAGHGVLDDAIGHSVAGVAGGEGRAVQERVLGGRNHGLRCGVHGAVDRHAAGVKVHVVDRGRAGDDGVEIRRIAHRRGNALPAPLRAAVPDRERGRAAVKGVNHRLGARRHLVHGAIAEVDHLLRMPERECGRVADVSGVGGRGGIAGRHRLGQRRVRECSPASRRSRRPGTSRSSRFSGAPRGRAATGSQTSILMSESLVGVSVAATRQKAGAERTRAPAVTGGVAPGAGGLPGATNAPAAIGSAAVTVACGSAQGRQRFARRRLESRRRQQTQRHREGSHQGPHGYLARILPEAPPHPRDLAVTMMLPSLDNLGD